MAGPVKVESHHEVVSWVRSKKASGTFRHCSHLKVVPSTFLDPRVRDPLPLAVFIPECECSSFEWKITCYGDHYAEQRVLVTRLDEDPISCPADCVNYASQGWARIRHAFQTFSNTACRWIATPFQWFAKLPAPQAWAVVGFMVLLIVLAVPRLKPVIVELLNAFHGK